MTLAQGGGGAGEQGSPPQHSRSPAPLRVLRIAVIAMALPLLFTISQRVSEARGNEPVPGLSWALGAISALFLVRAIVTERSLGAAESLQKDLLWGVTAGGILTIITRWLL
jgi:hypothetical protein